MTRYKTEELEGGRLNFAVAKAEGIDAILTKDGYCMRHGIGGGKYSRHYVPRVRWAEAGPIIEREGIDLEYHSETVLGQPQIWWEAYKREEGGSQCFTAPSPLIAAMRAYVAHKLGPEVELP
jgi:hypothetical protein